MKLDEGRICREYNWTLTSVVYDDTTHGKIPGHRVFYVQHDCSHKGQTLSYKSKSGEGWEQEIEKLSYIVCNHCAEHCPEGIFDKFIFLRAMGV